MDLAYLALLIILALVALGFLWLCERLGERK